MSAPVCEVPRCEHGWLRVMPAYVAAHAPEPDLPEEEGPAYDELRARLLQEWKQRQAALLDSWYPCRECNRKMFHRWAGGHLSRDHDRDECAECEAPGQHRRHRKEPANSLAIPTPSHPTDSDREAF